MYNILFNHTTATQDKVKVTRYAWKQTFPDWPNKDQDVLDWLSVTLINRKRLSKEENDCVWRCLHDVLHTSKCIKQSPDAQALMLKPALYQLLLQELSTASRENSDVIIACCQKVLTSPIFGHVWSSRLDNLLQILSCCTQLCSYQLGHKAQLSSQLLQLFNTAGQLYTAGCHQSANPQQVIMQVCQKLFSPVVLLLHTAKSYKGKLKEQLMQTSKILETILLTALFPKDLSGNYELYLKLKTSEDKSGSVPAKYIQALFTQTCSALHGPQENDILELLPWLYQGFVKQYIGSNHQMCFELCQYLCELLEIIPSKVPDTLAMTNSLTTVKKVIFTEQILRVMVTLDVYNMATDHIHGDKQLSWLRCLSQWVNNCSMELRSPAWFSIQCHLLELNYATIEANFKLFLEATWLQTNELALESRPAQVQLLHGLVTKYTQLRQLPKLLNQLTSVLLETEHLHEICFPEKFSDCLSECFQSQPPTVVLAIWKQLLELLIAQCKGEKWHEVCFLCNLLAVLLTSIRVVDSSSTHQMSVHVHDLMKSTGQDVLNPLLSNFSQHELRPGSAVVLQLADSWGQVQLVMTQFILSSDEPITDDLTVIVHNYLSDLKWTEIGKRVRTAGCPKCHLLWLKLKQQNLRMILCNYCKDEMLPDIVQVIDDSLSLLSQKITYNIPNVLDSKSLSVTRDNISIKVWSTICELLPLVADMLTDHQMGLIADHIVQSLSTQSKKVVDECDITSTEASHTSVTRQLIDSGATWEIPRLLTAILQSVWQKISDVLDNVCEVSPRKKRRLSSGFQHILVKLQKVLSMNVENSEVTSVCNMVCNWLKSLPKSVAMEKDSVSNITQLLQVLDCVPLLCLSTSDQLVHTLCTLILLAATKPSKHVHQLMKTGYSQLEQVYSSSGGPKLCTHFSPVHVLSWLATDVHKQLPEHILSSIMSLYKVLFKLASWSPDYLKPLQGTVSEFASGVDKGEPNAWHLKILVQMLEHTVRVFHKAYVPSGVLEALSPIHTTLSTLLKSIANAGKESVQSPTIDALVIRGYGMILAEQSDGLKNDLTSLMCDSCLQLMESHIEDPEVLDGCLVFLKSVCNYMNKRRSEASQHKAEEDTDHSPKHKTIKESSELMNHYDKSTSDSTSENDNASEEDDDDDSIVNIASSLLNDSDNLLSVFISKSWDYLFQYLQSSSSRAEEGTESGQRSQGYELVNRQNEIEQTLGHLVNASSIEQLSLLVNQLLHDVSLDKANEAPDKVIFTLRVWMILLESVQEEESFRILSTSSHYLLLHPLVAELQPSAAYYCHLVVTALNTQATILTSHKVPAQCVSLMIQTCHQAVHDKLVTDTFVSVFTAAHNVLSIILSHYTQCALARLPLLSMAIRHMLQTLVWFGRQPPEGVKDHNVTALAQCAHLMDRLLAQLCSNKTECAKIVVYLVADYTAALHKVTLLPAVKKNLLPAIHHCLDICDEHSIALLHATLSHGFVEIFKVLYEEYTKYHKYVGRV